MESRKVVLTPEALGDLKSLYEYIAADSGTARAISYIERIEDYCARFDLVAERGTRRDDIRPGLRIVGFERRVTIAFHVDQTTVTIDRILYGGRQDRRHSRRQAVTARRPTARPECLPR